MTELTLELIRYICFYNKKKYNKGVKQKQFTFESIWFKYTVINETLITYLGTSNFL